MSDDAFWRDLREECERLDPGAELETPVSERRFRIAATYADRIVVEFGDSGEERSLWREQFEVLADRVGEAGIVLDDLMPGVEPYAAVLSLSPTYAADDGELAFVPDDAASGESPFLIPPEEARSRPERVHDDALLLAALLDELDASTPTSLSTERLTDLYVLLSNVQRGADQLRRTTREPLLDRLGPDQTLHGRFGTVRRTTRERRTPKDEETVLDALNEYGIPHEWVLGIDPDKLDVVLAVTDLDESEVYDVDEQVYVQKTGVDEGEKYARLQGLLDRVNELESETGRQLREEVNDLERHLEERLSAD